MFFVTITPHGFPGLLALPNHPQQQGYYISHAFWERTRSITDATCNQAYPILEENEWPAQWRLLKQRPEESSLIKKDKENFLNSGNNYSSYLKEWYRWFSWEARAGSSPPCCIGQETTTTSSTAATMQLLHHGWTSKLSLTAYMAFETLKQKGNIGNNVPSALGSTMQETDCKERPWEDSPSVQLAAQESDSHLQLRSWCKPVLVESSAFCSFKCSGCIKFNITTLRVIISKWQLVWYTQSQQSINLSAHQSLVLFHRCDSQLMNSPDLPRLRETKGWEVRLPAGIWSKIKAYNVSLLLVEAGGVMFLLTLPFLDVQQVGGFGFPSHIPTPLRSPQDRAAFSLNCTSPIWFLDDSLHFCYFSEQGSQQNLNSVQ